MHETREDEAPSNTAPGRQPFLAARFGAPLPPMMELQLDLGATVRGPWRVERYGDSPTLAMAWIADERGVRIRFDSAPRSGVPLALRLCVTSPAEIAATAITEPSYWSMTRGIPRLNGGAATDLFAKIATWVHSEIYARDKPKSGTNPQRDPKEFAEASGTMRRLHARLRDLAMHAADQCDPVARSLVLRFPIHMRFPAYRRIVADRSGRIAQLATECPGALGFALALANRGAVAAGDRLLAGVIAGRRINPLLDEAIEAWAVGIREQGTEGPLQGARSPAWRRVVEAGPAESVRTRLEQRLLIRRAGPAVPGAYLWLPPPIAYAPEEIPRATRANAAWFRVTKCHSITLCADDEPDAALRRAISSFASAHAPAIWSLRRRSLRIADEIAELRDYLDATETIPSRRTDPEGLLAASRLWHADMQAVVDEDDQNGALDFALLDKTFPDPPLSAWSSLGVEVWPVTHAQELVAEGQRMKHCVASRLREVLAGRSAIYHAEVNGRSLTIEVLRRADSLVLGDMRGIANRVPSKMERKALSPWLHALD